MVSEKNNRVILRRKIFFREIAEEKKSYTEKKICFMAYNVEKKSYTFVCPGKISILSPEVWQKNKFLPKPNHPYSPHPPPPPPQKSNGRSLITLTRPVIYQNSCFISFHYIITCCSYFPRFLDEKDLPFKQKKA